MFLSVVIDKTVFHSLVSKGPPSVLQLCSLLFTVFTKSRSWNLHSHQLVVVDSQEKTVISDSISLAYAVSSPSQEGAGRESGQWLSFSFSKTWSSLTIDAPRRLALAPLFSYPHPWPTALFSRLPDAPSVTTTVPAQTHMASIPLDECPNATGS